MWRQTALLPRFSPSLSVSLSHSGCVSLCMCVVRLLFCVCACVNVVGGSLAELLDEAGETIIPLLWSFISEYMYYS